MFALAKAPGNIAINAEVTEVPSFFQAYQTYLVPNEEVVSIGTAIASRLIPSSNFAPGANSTALHSAIMQGIATAGNNILQPQSGTMVYGGAPFQVRNISLPPKKPELTLNFIGIDFDDHSLQLQREAGIAILSLGSDTTMA